LNVAFRRQLCGPSDLAEVIQLQTTTQAMVSHEINALFLIGSNDSPMPFIAILALE
jgi:hypothetical protein